MLLVQVPWDILMVGSIICKMYNFLLDVSIINALQENEQKYTFRITSNAYEIQTESFFLLYLGVI